jgi:cysteine synthase
VQPKAIYDEAHALADHLNGHFMDQFTYAERATDWRGNNNIAASIFAQMERERFPVPRWIVVGAGTGGTSSTIARTGTDQIFAVRHSRRWATWNTSSGTFRRVTLT